MKTVGEVIEEFLTLLSVKVANPEPLDPAPSDVVPEPDPEPFEFSYKEYLLSEEWKQTRQRILDRDGNRCLVCNSPKNLNVHHRTYERIGAEHDSDLTTMCQPCHAVFHAHRTVSREDPGKFPRLMISDT